MGGNKKSRRESDVDGNSTPSRPTRSRKPSSKQRGGLPNQGGIPLEQIPISPLCTKLSSRGKLWTVEESCRSVPQSPQRPTLCYRRKRSPNGGPSPVQECPTSNANTGQLTGADEFVATNSSIDGLGSGCSRQAAQVVKPLEDASNHGSCKSSDFELLFGRLNEILRSTEFPDKFTLLRTEVGQFVDLQAEKAQAEIVSLKAEAIFTSARLQFCARLLYGAQVEIDNWRRQGHALQEERSVLNKENEVLQQSIENLLNARVGAAESSIDPIFHKDLKQMMESEIFSKLLHHNEIRTALASTTRSLNEMDRALTVELQKRSHENESCVKLKEAEESGRKLKRSRKHESGVMLKSGVQANGQQQFDEICGSYTDDSATPNLLDDAFTATKAAVTRLQKMIFEALKLFRRDKLWHLLEPDMVFARKNHVGFYLRSVMNEMFFEGFENESFNTFQGVSRFLDPNLRQTNFYAYYRNNTGDIEDPQFVEFYETKVSSLWKMFPLYINEKVCCFEQLGGPETGIQLALSFKAAARSVWLLHKLAFSFEPPASIFRVESGADVDPTYMDTVVKLEDDERFVAKVGFMLTPGLRLRKTVMRCEVYLSGEARTTPT